MTKSGRQKVAGGTRAIVKQKVALKWRFTQTFSLIF